MTVEPLPDNLQLAWDILLEAGPMAVADLQRELSRRKVVIGLGLLDNAIDRRVEYFARDADGRVSARLGFTDPAAHDGDPRRQRGGKGGRSAEKDDARE